MTPRSKATTERARSVGLRVASCALLCVAPSAGAETIVLQAAAVHVGDGRVIENATLVIRDGRIVAVGADVGAPEGATVIEVDGAVTPGLIDANAVLAPTDRLPTPSRGGARLSTMRRWAAAQSAARSPQVCCEDPFHEHVAVEPVAAGRSPGLSLAEHSAEVIPHTRALDAVNLRSPDLARLLRGGVTTVFVAPDPGAVISSQGAVIRTGGPLAERVVRPAGAVKVTFGTDAIRRGARNTVPRGRAVPIFARRPNTRMGVTWVFRKAFHDAERVRTGLPVYGADTPSTDALAVLQRVRAGEIPLRVQARMQHDILSALRVCDEFGLRFTLEEATEAYRCIDELKAHETAVVFGPISDRPADVRFGGGETQKTRFATLRVLLDAGIETALSAMDRRDEDGLARQAMYAMRAGVSPADALRAVTATPARILGLDKQIGTLEAGKRADVVVWSGAPFAATSRPVLVLVGGKIVVDRRK